MRRNIASIDQVVYTWRHHGRRAAVRVARDRAKRQVGRWMLAHQYPDVTWGRDVSIQGKVVIRGTGTVVIGDRVTLAGHTEPVQLVAPYPGSRIEIGDDCGLSGTLIIATDLVRIGRGSALARARIADNDWHDVTGQRRGAGAVVAPRPVVIGANAWLGDGAMVTSGVTIGDSAVVGAGSVVRTDVAPFTVVIGNPHRSVRDVTPARATLDIARVIELIEDATQSVPGTIQPSSRIDDRDLWDSLSVVEFMEMVEAETGLELSLDDVADCGTAEDLAAAIAARLAP